MVSPRNSRNGPSGKELVDGSASVVPGSVSDPSRGLSGYALGLRDPADGSTIGLSDVNGFASSVLNVDLVSDVNNLSALRTASVKWVVQSDRCGITFGNLDDISRKTRAMGSLDGSGCGARDD